jgi:hypothetical protein
MFSQKMTRFSEFKAQIRRLNTHEIVLSTLIFAGSSKTLLESNQSQIQKIHFF